MAAKVYTPNETTPVSKPWGFYGIPADGRTECIDVAGSNYVRRAYRSLAEVRTVLPLLNPNNTPSGFRKGSYAISVNLTGTYNSATGDITGGKIEIYRWTKGNESTDSDLEPWTDLSAYVTSTQLNSLLDALNDRLDDLELDLDQHESDFDNPHRTTFQEVLDENNTSTKNTIIGDGTNTRGYALVNGSGIQGNTNQTFLYFGSSGFNNYIDQIAGAGIQRRVGGTVVNQWFSDGRLSGANAQNAKEFTTKEQLDVVSGSITNIAEISYAMLQSDHKTYTNTGLAGKSFKLFQNGINRFLTTGEYTITSTGGFVLVNELSDGDTLELLGQVTGAFAPTSLSIPTFASYTALNAATPRQDGIYKVTVDDSPGGDGTESFYLSFQNILNYLVTLE